MSRRNRKSPRLAATSLKADRAALVALKNLTSYVPSSADISTNAACTLEQLLREKEEKHLLSRIGLASDRDSRDGAEWDLHDIMLSIKDCVRGQFGADSDELQSLGLKKKSDYRRPQRTSSSS